LEYIYSSPSFIYCGFANRNVVFYAKLL